MNAKGNSEEEEDDANEENGGVSPRRNKMICQIIW